jgi:tRNA A-37 threonylcarbamoyl transferase component Bud32
VLTWRANEPHGADRFTLPEENELKPRPTASSPPRIDLDAAAERSSRLGVDEDSPRRRRRPSGEPPPLPRPLGTSGKLLLAYIALVFALFVLVGVIGSLDEQLDRWEGLVLQFLAGYRTPSFTTVMQAIAGVLSSAWLLAVLWWGAVIGLVALKRFRHLFVFLGSALAIGLVTTSVSALAVRARPFGVSILGEWYGGSLPSRPVAAFTSTLLGIAYSFFVAGAPRNLAKSALRVALGILVFARLYLGIDHPIDVVTAVALATGITVVAFRLLAPNEVFPVSYRRGRAAHLDVGGERGRAIKRALESQLGISVVVMKPFGLAGSGGSTPLRLKVAGEPEKYLFAKLYAQNHLRADRWYKLGRTLLYGRLEDEGRFSTVRRLVQYEDHMLRVMRDAGVRVPAPHGFVEITPEREYVLVTDFVDGAKESLEAEIDDAVIDDGLRLVRQLWDAGLAHRDIKPSNLLIRDRKVHLIDVAFGQMRPSPWRQAVDLANLMVVVLAFRTSPEQVYARAVNFFSPDEIAEAFAATRGATMPSQSRSLLRKGRSNLVDRFRELAPARRPVRIQRWSVRRVGTTLVVLLVTLIIVMAALGNLPGAGLVPGATEQAFSRVGRPPLCGRFQGEALYLEAQSVPSAALVPCLNALPLGWKFAGLYVRKGSTQLVFDYDREGQRAALRVSLHRSCDTSGAEEVIPSEEPGTRRYDAVEATPGRYAGVRYYVFSGGCITYRFDISDAERTVFTSDAELTVGLYSRAALEDRVRRTTGLSL